MEIGTSTNTVFQSDIAPFHNPGNSRAFNSFPFLDFREMNPVFLSTKSGRLYFSPFLFLTAQTKSTGLKWVDASNMAFDSGFLRSIWELSRI